MKETGQLKWMWTIGAIMRGKARRVVVMVCEQNGLEWDIQEEKGFLDSLFIFTVKGPSGKLLQLRDWVKQVEKDWNSA